MKEWIKKIFRRKDTSTLGEAVRGLSIEGISPAPLTPEPDDAELAAQALLELMAEAAKKQRRYNVITMFRHNDKAASRNNEKETSAAHYRALAARIREAHEAARRKALRFVAACEYELQKPDLPLTGPCSLQLLEAELYKRIDIIEREGGDLKRRWQHCLANVTIRMMGYEA